MGLGAPDGLEPSSRLPPHDPWTGRAPGPGRNEKETTPTCARPKPTARANELEAWGRGGRRTPRRDGEDFTELVTTAGDELEARVKWPV